MKRKARVRRRGKIVSLAASVGVEHYSSARGDKKLRAWVKRLAELRRWRSLPKKRVTMYLDADVLAWYRAKGPGYQWEINRALRKVMMKEKLQAPRL
ncbi:MAG: BrnA antitoxin family protein [Terriglobales bacterium]